MLAPSDRIVLAHGVELDDHAIVDPVRGERYPLNATGEAALEAAGATLGDAADALVRVWGVDPATARADALGFGLALNAAYLANVEREGGRIARVAGWLGLALRLAPAGRWPGTLARRRHVRTDHPARAAASTLRALAARSATLAAVTSALAAQPLALVGILSPAPLLVGVATALGLAVHEAGHACLLRGVPAAIVTHGRRTFVLHGRVDGRRRAAVAGAGPAAPALLGAAAAAGAAAVASAELALAALPLAAHAIGASVLTRDGRTACGC